MISKMHNFCRSVRDSSIYKNNKYAIFGQPRLCRKKHFILKFNANKRVCLEEKLILTSLFFGYFFPNECPGLYRHRPAGYSLGGK